MTVEKLEAVWRGCRGNWTHTSGTGLGDVPAGEWIVVEIASAAVDDENGSAALMAARFATVISNHSGRYDTTSETSAPARPCLRSSFLPTGRRAASA